jgi:hypothetical protein
MKSNKCFVPIGKSVHEFSSGTSLKDKVLSNIGVSILQAITDVNNYVGSVKDYNLEWSVKEISEFISNNIGKRIATHLNAIGIKTKSTGCDNDPDLCSFSDTSNETYILEVKVCNSTKSTPSWRGGALSKRESDHLLVTWKKNDDGSFSVYACVMWLNKVDWIPAKEGMGDPKIKPSNLIRDYRIDIIGQLLHCKFDNSTKIEYVCSNEMNHQAKSMASFNNRANAAKFREQFFE